MENVSINTKYMYLQRYMYFLNEISLQYLYINMLYVLTYIACPQSLTPDLVESVGNAAVLKSKLFFMISK